MNGMFFVDVSRRQPRQLPLKINRITLKPFHSLTPRQWSAVMMVEQAQRSCPVTQIMVILAQRVSRSKKVEEVVAFG